MTVFPEWTIRFPPSLSLDIRIVSEREGQSPDSFIVQAVAEKVAALRARGLADPLTPEEQLAYLQARAARAQTGALKRVLAKAGTTTEVQPGDELLDLGGEASGSRIPPGDRKKSDPRWGSW